MVHSERVDLQLVEEVPSQLVGASSVEISSDLHNSYGLDNGVVAADMSKLLVSKVCCLEKGLREMSSPVVMVLVLALSSSDCALSIASQWANNDKVISQYSVLAKSQLMMSFGICW